MHETTFFAFLTFLAAQYILIIIQVNYSCNILWLLWGDKTSACECVIK